MRHLIATIALLFVASIAPCNPTDPAAAGKPKAGLDCCDIEGIYSVKGDGYSGVLKLRKLGQTYLAEWFLQQEDKPEAGDDDDGAAVIGDKSKSITLSYTMVGVGIRTGDSLAVGWTMGALDKGLMRGVTTYAFEVADGGKQVQARGQWMSLPGSGKAAAERIVLLRRFPKDV